MPLHGTVSNLYTCVKYNKHTQPSVPLILVPQTYTYLNTHTHLQQIRKKGRMHAAKKIGKRICKETWLPHVHNSVVPATTATIFQSSSQWTCSSYRWDMDSKIYSTLIGYTLYKNFCDTYIDFNHAYIMHRWVNLVVTIS